MTTPDDFRKAAEETKSEGKMTIPELRERMAETAERTRSGPWHLRHLSAGVYQACLREVLREVGLLVATPSGWRCPVPGCGYEQE